MVFVLNPDATRFYERLGFVPIEEFGAYVHMEWRGEVMSAECRVMKEEQ
jgi:predicted GNAT family acetyltransferase